VDRVVVVGAGCFGAWTAYELARAGREVVLLDAFGPGNSRASSGGETRIIRMGYGAQDIYTRWSLRSLGLWKALEARTASRVFHQTGVLWISRGPDPLTTATLAALERCGVAHEHLSGAELEARWPQIACGALGWAIFEPESGVLMARRAVELVVRDAVREGTRYATTAVDAPRRGRGRIDAVATRSGETIAGSTFVFACGPWLPALFPDLLDGRIFATRQEVLYFGPPPGDSRFAPPALPLDRFRRGDGAASRTSKRAAKIALDRRGPPFDPGTGDRLAGRTLPEVRAYLARRFPALRDAPLIAAEVCQYENSGNGDFLIDRHPDLENVWLVGGGSGHGFKHGPAVGEYVARLVNEGGAVEDRFSLATKERVQQRAICNARGSPVRTLRVSEPYRANRYSLTLSNDMGCR
jgi:glycine/D-amino acid oxidase-like deaminating enzyme